MSVLYYGQELYRANELEQAAGAGSIYLAHIRPQGESHFTARSIVQSYDTAKRENRHRLAPHAAWQAAHPALVTYFLDCFASSTQALAALTGEGYDVDAPLSDADLRALLGEGLFDVRYRVFRQSSFYSATDIEGIKERHERERAETEARAKRKAEVKAKRRAESDAARALERF